MKKYNFSQEEKQHLYNLFDSVIMVVLSIMSEEIKTFFDNPKSIKNKLSTLDIISLGNESKKIDSEWSEYEKIDLLLHLFCFEEYSNLMSAEIQSNRIDVDFSCDLILEGKVYDLEDLKVKMTFECYNLLDDYIYPTAQKSAFSRAFRFF